MSVRTWKLFRLAQVLGLNPERLATAALRIGRQNDLARFCTDTLKRIGELPPPTDAPQLDAGLAPEQRQEPSNFGNYWHDCRDQIQAYRAALADNGVQPVFLDVGGSQGECRSFAEGFRYWIADLVVRTPDVDRAITGDVCRPLPIEPGSIDVVFSNQVFEHLAHPWEALGELGKLLKPGGLFVTITIMSYRYHPFPEDYFRFTHAGLRALHEQFAGTSTLLCNYDIRNRRHDHRGGAHPTGADRVPVDYLGGFRENWFVYYIGRKLPLSDPSAESQQ